MKSRYDCYTYLGIIISLSSSFREPSFLAWIWATAVEIPLTLMNVKNHISVTRMQQQHRKHCKGGLNMHSSAESCVSSCYLGVYPMVENAKNLENAFWILCVQHASKSSKTISFVGFFFLMPGWFCKPQTKFIFISPVQNAADGFSCNRQRL